MSWRQGGRGQGASRRWRDVWGRGHRSGGCVGRGARGVLHGTGPGLERALVRRGCDVPGVRLLNNSRVTRVESDPWRFFDPACQPEMLGSHVILYLICSGETAMIPDFAKIVKRVCSDELYAHIEERGGDALNSPVLHHSFFTDAQRISGGCLRFIISLQYNRKRV